MLRVAVDRNSTAMAERQLVSIEGQPWINYKNAMRDHLRVRFELDVLASLVGFVFYV